MQIVSNVLSNALKYGRGQPVEIGAWVEGARAFLSVRDHGTGIAAADRERIFGRFERAVAVSSYGGFGLGLYISRQIAEAHGGSIHVKSSSGAGTTFLVELPVRQAAARGELSWEQTR